MNRSGLPSVQKGRFGWRGSQFLYSLYFHCTFTSFRHSRAPLIRTHEPRKLPRHTDRTPSHSLLLLLRPLPHNPILDRQQTKTNSYSYRPQQQPWPKLPPSNPPRRQPRPRRCVSFDVADNTNAPYDRSFLFFRP